MTEQAVGQEAVTESTAVSAEEKAFYERHAEEGATSSAQVAPETQVVEVDDTGEVEGETDDKGDNKGKFVRHGAFHQERERRKQLEATLQAKDLEFARVNERLAILAAAMQQAPQARQEEPAALPDIETDPIGYMKHLGEQLKAASQRTEEVQRAAQQDAEVRAVVTTYQADANRFAQEAPDFKDAYGHLMQGRDRELTLYGIADPAQRAQIIHQEEQQLVKNAVAQGRRPAQVVYELAKARGYSAPPAAAPQQPAAKDEVQRIADAAKANRSLSNMAGGSAKTELTAQDLLSMSDKEFAALEESVKRKLMGG